MCQTGVLHTLSLQGQTPRFGTIKKKNKISSSGGNETHDGEVNSLVKSFENRRCLKQFYRKMLRGHLLIITSTCRWCDKNLTLMWKNW